MIPKNLVYFVGQYLRQFCETPTWHRTANHFAKLVLGKVIGEGIGRGEFIRPRGAESTPTCNCKIELK